MFSSKENSSDFVLPTTTRWMKTFANQKDFFINIFQLLIGERKFTHFPFTLTHANDSLTQAILSWRNPLTIETKLKMNSVLKRNRFCFLSELAFSLVPTAARVKRLSIAGLELGFRSQKKVVFFGGVRISITGNGACNLVFVAARSPRENRLKEKLRQEEQKRKNRISV